ncbi:MAG: hypothetical protein HY814_09270 [Candidatus Riflebacteria bacterium]|nr:hypothetical protein [Candidatus Riflebacteria bacterium]
MSDDRTTQGNERPEPVAAPGNERPDDTRPGSDAPGGGHQAGAAPGPRRCRACGALVLTPPNCWLCETSLDHAGPTRKVQALVAPQPLRRTATRVEYSSQASSQRDLNRTQPILLAAMGVLVLGVLALSGPGLLLALVLIPAICSEVPLFGRGAKGKDLDDGRLSVLDLVLRVAGKAVTIFFTMIGLFLLLIMVLAVTCLAVGK